MESIFGENGRTRKKTEPIEGSITVDVNTDIVSLRPGDLVQKWRAPKMFL